MRSLLSSMVLLVFVAGNLFAASPAVLQVELDLSLENAPRFIRLGSSTQEQVMGLLGSGRTAPPPENIDLSVLPENANLAGFIKMVINKGSFAYDDVECTQGTFTYLAGYWSTYDDNGKPYGLSRLAEIKGTVKDDTFTATNVQHLRLYLAFSENGAPHPSYQPVSEFYKFRRYTFKCDLNAAIESAELYTLYYEPEHEETESLSLDAPEVQALIAEESNYWYEEQPHLR